MKIGYANAQGINNVEWWYYLEQEELKRRGHEIYEFNLKYKPPERSKIKELDIIHIHFAQVADHFKRLGKPFIISPHAHDIWRDDGATLKKASQHKNCVAISYQSFYHKKKFEEWGIEKPLVYLPMCCRTELFKRETPYNPSGKIIAGGRLIPKKGLDRLKGVENLTIFGDGPLRQGLQATLGSTTSLIGFLNGSELKKLFEESSIYLFPAIVTPDGDSDGIANTVKEAMLMELPVITSTVAGMSELENVIHLDNWTKINDILNSEGIKTRNWKGRQEILKTYSPEVTVSMLLKAIEKYI